METERMGFSIRVIVGCDMCGYITSVPIQALGGDNTTVPQIPCESCGDGRMLPPMITENPQNAPISKNYLSLN